MQIILIGANGQVGAEITLLLANSAGIKVRPIVRSRSGSAFLRFRGVPVMHGSVSDPAQSKRLQDGGDVIANFALALGTPALSMANNEQNHCPDIRRLSSISCCRVLFHSGRTRPLRYRAPSAAHDVQQTEVAQ